ncbi:MAG: hypothetical protein MZV70_50810 [Desulfobacterales bacterium]|nr:hypothetical protein [Desulfobacterales bacterium]
MNATATAPPSAVDADAPVQERLPCAAARRVPPAGRACASAAAEALVVRGGEHEQQRDAGRVPAAHLHAVDAVEHRVEVAEHRDGLAANGASAAGQQVAHLGDVGQDLRPQAPGDVPQPLDPLGHAVDVRRVQAAHVRPRSAGPSASACSARRRGQAVDLAPGGPSSPKSRAEGVRGVSGTGPDCQSDSMQPRRRDSLRPGAALGCRPSARLCCARAPPARRDPPAGSRPAPAGRLEGHDPGDAAAEARAPAAGTPPGDPAGTPRQAAAEIDRTRQQAPSRRRRQAAASKAMQDATGGSRRRTWRSLHSATACRMIQVRSKAGLRIRNGPAARSRTAERCRIVPL